MIPDTQLVDIVGNALPEQATGKKTAHPSVAPLIQGKVYSIGIYKFLSNTAGLDLLKHDKQKLVNLYQLITSLNSYYIGGRENRDTPLPSIPFVLADDDHFYPPNQVVALQLELNTLPAFLKAIVEISNKKFLHPDIAKDENAVSELERCGLTLVSEKTVLQRTRKLVGEIKTPGMCPPLWQYPEDFIRAELLLLSKGDHSIDILVTGDGSLQAAKNTFAPGSPLDWEPLYKNGWLAPGYYPVHDKYFQINTEFGLSLDQVYVGLAEFGAHGFRPDRDDEVIQHTAYQIAESKLSTKGHKIKDVHDQTKLGYDLKCDGHCAAVFEVKGMSEPKDIPLEESEWNAADPQQNKDYTLVCVYYLPAQPNKVGYRETTNVHNIGIPVERAIVPKEKWLYP